MPNDVEVDDRRAALEAAFEKVEAASTAETPSEVAPAAQAEAAPETEESAPSVESARTRDEKGRFVPGSAVKGNPAVRPTETGAQEGVAPPPPAAVIGLPLPATPPASVPEPWEKAPQSLKPEAREKWAAVPAELKQEWHRRERDTSVALQKAAETSRHAEPLLNIIRPYAQTLQQRGVSPEQVIGNFLRTEQALSNPDPKARAQIIAQALKTYQVPIDALAEAIDAAPQAIDPEALVQQAVQRFQQIQQQAEQQKHKEGIAAAIAKFSQDNDFVEGEGGVGGIMATLLQQGVAKDLKDAYERSCWADPRIRGILQQREASKQAATKAQATQRAHAASSSVKSSPGGGNGAAAPGDSVRSHLEASWSRIHGE